MKQDLEVQKLIQVAKMAGMNQTKKGQATTYSIFDALEVALSPNTYEFFQGANNRSFPDTNLNGGSLPQTEAMVAKAMHFSIVEYTTGVISGSSTLEALDPAFLQGVVNVKINDSIVVRDFPVELTKAEFNPFGRQDVFTGIIFQTNLIIPALSPFSVSLKLPAGIAADANKKIKCTITGYGVLQKLGYH